MRSRASAACLSSSTRSSQQAPAGVRRLLGREYGSDHIVHVIYSGETVYPGFPFATLFPAWLEKGYDVYCDTSMFPLFVLAWLLRHLGDSDEGRSRILFATDSPWSDFMSEYWKVESLQVPEAWKQAVFWDNAVRLYDRRAAAG